MPPVFPASDLDTPDTVQALLGSFWAGTYDGAGQVRDYVMALCQAYRQAGIDLAEAQQSLVWRSVPLLHTVEWYPLTILASERLNANLTGLRFSATSSATFGAAGAFGQPLAGAAQPAALGNVIDAPALLDAITTPKACLIRDVDYTLDTIAGALEFRVDPFKDPRFSPQPIFDANGNQTDSELIVWLWRAKFDLQNLQTQVGYALGLTVPSTPAAQQLVTTLLDGLQAGSSRAVIEALLQAICGVQLTQSDGETVQVVTTDARGLLIVTSANVYRFPAGTRALVTVGQVVNAGAPLADTLQLFDLNAGVTPSALADIAVGPQLLEPGYQADLIFPNMTVPVQVTTDLPTNKTRISWALGGVAADVTRFWNDVHARGVAAGKTLANLLDVRPAPVMGEPTAASLPATVNPLQFLVTNVLRCGVVVAQLSVAGMAPTGLGVPALRHLRRVVPPHQLVLVIVTLPNVADGFTVNNGEALTAPGLGMRQLVETGASVLPASDPLWIMPHEY